MGFSVQLKLILNYKSSVLRFLTGYVLTCYDLEIGSRYMCTKMVPQGKKLALLVQKSFSYQLMRKNSVVPKVNT
jgi:hypothetical protein